MEQIILLPELLNNSLSLPSEEFSQPIIQRFIIGMDDSTRNDESSIDSQSTTDKYTEPDSQENILLVNGSLTTNTEITNISNPQQENLIRADDQFSISTQSTNMSNPSQLLQNKLINQLNEKQLSIFKKKISSRNQQSFWHSFSVQNDSLSLINSFELNGSLDQNYENFNVAFNQGQNALQNILQLFERSDNLGLEPINQDCHKLKQYQYSLNEIIKQKKSMQKFEEIFLNQQEKQKQLNQLQQCYFNAAQYQKVWSLCVKRLSYYQDKDGDNRPKIAKYYNNIGNIFRILGFYGPALKHYNQSFNFRKSLIQQKPQSLQLSLDYSITINNLGIINQNLGYSNEALKYYKLASQIRKKREGKKSMKYASSLNNLGLISMTQCNYKKAEFNFKKSLQVKESIINGSFHHEYADTLNNLGILYYRIGKLEQALQIYKKSYTLRKKIFDENHPDCATSLNNIGLVYLYQNKYELAFQNLKKALQIRIKNFTIHHLSCADSYNNLGSYYLRINQNQKALEQYMTSLEIKKDSLRQNHPQIGIIKNNIGSAYFNLQNLLQSLKYYKNSLRILRLQFSQNHQDIIKIKQNIKKIQKKKQSLMYFCQKTKKLFKVPALSNYSQIQLKQCLKFDKYCKQIYGSKNINFAQNSFKLAKIFYFRGQYYQAYPYFQDISDFYSSSQVKNLPQYIRSSYNLAVCLFQSQLYQLSLQQVKKSFQILNKLSTQSQQLKILKILFQEQLKSLKQNAQTKKTEHQIRNAEQKIDKMDKMSQIQEQHINKFV